MALPEGNILQTFFETSTLAKVSVEQLKQITDEQPYYGAAHFLLAKKLYHSKQNGFEQALQKAALHFSNELLLHFNLNEDEEEPETIAETEKKTKVEFSINEPAIESPIEIIDEEETTDNNDFTEDVILSDKLSSMLQQQAAEFEKPIEAPAEIPVEITPYHRVDYFDSQGIKLEEEKADDKLASQLKRFTDWLKQMKRVTPNPTELRNDEAGEHQVQNIAEHSNEPEDIVTETMAEVLIKQGKPEQAIHIYEKLSFNNPSKSAYFAAKIQELKG